MDWSSFTCGLGFGAACAFVLVILMLAMRESGTPPADALDYETGEPE